MSFDKHSKIKDILTSLESLVGINQKEELKEVLRNKGLTINDTDSISDMITKINNIILGDAKPEDVILNKAFSSTNGYNQKGTFDLSVYKRNASGTTYPVSDTNINVSGLNFRPSILILYFYDNKYTYYNNDLMASREETRMTFAVNLLSNGFALSSFSHTLSTITPVNWIAIE